MLKHVTHELVQGARLYHENPVADGGDLLQLLLFSEGYGTWRLHLASGEAFWSPQIYKIFGMEPREGPVDLEQAIKVYHEEDATVLALLIKEAVEQKCGFKFVFRVHRLDGAMRLVESTASVRLGSNGKPVDLYGVFRDVTDDKLAQDISKGRSLLMRSIIENSPLPMCVLDKSMRYLDISQSWRLVHADGQLKPAKGMSHEKVLGQVTKAWEADVNKVIEGQIVQHNNADLFFYAGNKNAEFTSMIPWRGASGGVNGIIMMLTSAGLAQLQTNLKKAG